jgi:hypothetical protein
MKRLAHGSDVDLRPPFFANKDRSLPPREEIVNNFHPVFNASKDFPLDILLRLEEEQRGNIGEMSSYLPWHKDGPQKVQAVYTDKLAGRGFNATAWDRSGERLESLFGGNRVPLSSFDQAVSGEASRSSEDVESGMDTTTNSAHPYYLNGWKPSDSTPPKKLVETIEAFKWYKDFVENAKVELNDEYAKLPEWMCIVGQRLVQRDPEHAMKRKRIIIAFPKGEAILWKLFSPAEMELIREWFLSGVRVMCGWMNLTDIDINMQRMLRNAEQHNRSVLSGDVSNFDATLPPFAITDTGRILARHVDGNENLVVHLVDSMVNNAYLITPDRLYKPQPSSLKSGSGGTNLLGSLANMRVQFYGEEIGYYKLDTMTVLGDDFCIDGDHVSPDATSEVFKHFGMESHPSKQFHERGALHFLQRLHVLGYPGGIASVYRTLGSFLSLEKMSVKAKDWSPWAYIVRAISQLQNAVFNPAFEPLVQYCMSGDKYRLGADYTPEEVSSMAGESGRKLIGDDVNAPWKRMPAKTAFGDWAVNGVIRGKVLPSPGGERFKFVHGVDSNF